MGWRRLVVSGAQSSGLLQGFMADAFARDVGGVDRKCCKYLCIELGR